MVHLKLTPLAFFPLPLPLVSPTAYEEPRYAFLNPHVR
jgi:hypothetical protein